MFGDLNVATLYPLFHCLVQTDCWLVLVRHEFVDRGGLAAFPAMVIAIEGCEQGGAAINTQTHIQ